MLLKRIARVVVLAGCAGYGGVILWRIVQETQTDPSTPFALALVTICLFGPICAAATPRGHAFVKQHPMRCIGIGLALLTLGALWFGVVFWAGLHDMAPIPPALAAYVGVALLLTGAMVTLQPAFGLLLGALRKPDPPARDPASTFE